MIIVLFIIS